MRIWFVVTTAKIIPSKPPSTGSVTWSSCCQESKFAVELSMKIIWHEQWRPLWRVQAREGESSDDSTPAGPQFWREYETFHLCVGWHECLLAFHHQEWCQVIEKPSRMWIWQPKCSFADAFLPKNSFMFWTKFVSKVFNKTSLLVVPQNHEFW